MTRNNSVDRTDLYHEIFFSLTKNEFELPEDKFTTNINCICLSNLLKTSLEATVSYGSQSD